MLITKAVGWAPESSNLLLLTFLFQRNDDESISGLVAVLPDKFSFHSLYFLPEGFFIDFLARDPAFAHRRKAEEFLVPETARDTVGKCIISRHKAVPKICGQEI